VTSRKKYIPSMCAGGTKKMREKGKGMAWCDSSLQTPHQWLFISINLYGKNVEQEKKLRLNWFYLGLLVNVTVTSLPYIWL